MSRPVATAVNRRMALHMAACWGLAGAAQAAEASLPLSASLRHELGKALTERQPLVVMVSLHGCPWCKLVRTHYLAPMRAEKGLAVVQIDMRSNRATHTVDGAPTTHDALVRGWGIKLAPTLLFLGAGGQEVAERLAGGSPDFYSGYLDQRLAQARRAVAGPGG